MTVDGLVATPRTWTWREMHALPQSTYFGDIHCVTTWSKFDTTFAGVSVDTLLELAGPLPGGGVRDGALDHRLHHQPAARRRHRRQGLGGLGLRRPPLPVEHGGPVRLLVPHLYFWKSAKWVTRLELMATRPARLLGAERLPRPRRPVARAALPGRSVTHSARRRLDHRPDRRDRALRRPPGPAAARGRRPDRPPARPALRASACAPPTTTPPSAPTPSPPTPPTRCSS